MARHTLVSGIATAVCVSMVAGLAAAPMAAFAQPQLSIQSEQMAHPNFVRAIHEAEDAYRLLQSAPNNFGGNKAQAMDDLHHAIHSMKRALYYRLNMDDAAIDRIR